MSKEHVCIYSSYDHRLIVYVLEQATDTVTVVLICSVDITAQFVFMGYYVTIMHANSIIL